MPGYGAWIWNDSWEIERERWKIIVEIAVKISLWLQNWSSFGIVTAMIIENNWIDFHCSRLYTLLL